MCSSLRVWHRCIITCVPVLLGLWTASLQAQNSSNGFWQAQSIYQIITDRFFDGDPSNNNADGNYSPTGTTSVHGGDFKGARAKARLHQGARRDGHLDFARGAQRPRPVSRLCGPRFLQGGPALGQPRGFAAFDRRRRTPRGCWSLTTSSAITAMTSSTALIPAIPTFLAPPAGYTLKYYSSSLTYAPPFDIYNSTYTPANNALTNLFHNYGDIPDYNTPQHYQLGELSGLDDFRTESPYVRSNMAAIYNTGFSRPASTASALTPSSTLKIGFWQYWCPPVHTFAATNSAKPNFFMFGEVYDSSESLCGSYTGTESGGRVHAGFGARLSALFPGRQRLRLRPAAPPARLTVITTTSRPTTTPTRRCGS